MSASWRIVMRSPFGTPSRYWSTVSSRPTFPSSTSCRISVTVKDLVTLRSGHAMSAVGSAPVLRSATPVAETQLPWPGTNTPTTAAGVP